MEARSAGAPRSPMGLSAGELLHTEVNGLSGGLVGAAPAARAHTVERAGVDVERVIGAARASHPGPTLIVVAGIHGNEPGGVLAARRVLTHLQASSLLQQGEVTVLAGNMRALRGGKRFLERDLNRGWSDEQVDGLMRRAPNTLDAEDREQRELFEAIEAVRRQAHGPVVIADLHTSSAPGLPFVLFSDTLPQQRFVEAFPIPIIIGLVEQVDGVLTEFFTRRGCVTFCVEGGQHESESSVDALEAVLWLSLATAGMIDPALEQVERAARLLDEQRRGLPRVLEVMHRHSITHADAFVMEPGFKNIEAVSAGQLLARDARGEIRAQEDGVVVLPLYQKLGSDGFFWARSVERPRLLAARALRTLRLDALAGLLPGVRWADHPHRIVVDRASPQVRALLRLLGFRRERHHSGVLTWERAHSAE